MYATVTKKTYFCTICDDTYGNCQHTYDKQTLPKDERGETLSLTEYDVLVAAGDI